VQPHRPPHGTSPRAFGDGASFYHHRIEGTAEDLPEGRLHLKHFFHRIGQKISLPRVKLDRVHMPFADCSIPIPEKTGFGGALGGQKMPTNGPGVGEWLAAGSPWPGRFFCQHVCLPPLRIGQIPAARAEP